MLTLLLAVLLIFSNKAHANKNNEFFWQADEKEFYLSSTVHVISIKANYKTDHQVYVKQSGTLTDLNAEYGLNEKLSVGFGTSYRRMHTEFYPFSKNDFKGLGDLDFNLKGVHSLDHSNLRYGTAISFSLGDTVLTNGNQNGHSGRNILIPYIGFDTSVKDYTAGAALSYIYYMGNRKINYEGVPEEYQGGYVLTFTMFAEKSLPKGIKAGTSVEYDITGDQKVKSSGEKIEGLNQLYISIYGSNEVLDALTITFQLGYLYADKSQDFENYKGFLGYVGARYRFE